MYSDAYVAALSWFAGWSTRERAIDISMALVKPDIGPSTWEVLATSDNQEVIFNGTVDEFMDMMKERSDNAKPTD